MLRRLILLPLILLMTPFSLTAQGDDRPPQFLYRDGDHLLLVSIMGETSELLELPHILVRESDRFRWSPDGRYLLALFLETAFNYCLNVYDVEHLVWVSDLPVACGVKEAVFGNRVDMVSFVTVTTLPTDTTYTNFALNLYSIENQTNEVLHETGYTDPVGLGLGNVSWSPTDRYITYVEYDYIMGGSIDHLHILSYETRETYTLDCRCDPYYAYYEPVWGRNDDWYLIVLKEEYVGGGRTPTNHRGDVYLVNSAIGEIHRITFSPAEAELNLHWTSDWHIAYEVIHNVSLSVTEALNVTEVPSDQIVTPEPFEDDPWRHIERFALPGANLWARTVTENIDTVSLHIGSMEPFREIYSILLPEGYRQDTGLIGWRPNISQGS